MHTPQLHRLLLDRPASCLHGGLEGLDHLRLGRHPLLTLPHRGLELIDFGGQIGTYSLGLSLLLDHRGTGDLGVLERPKGGCPFF